MALSVDIRKKLGAFELNVQFECGDEILALLGPSGCGKSMTLKCIAGIETPDEGRIVLDDRVLFDKEARVNLTPQQRRVGYLFQQYALFPNMTVAQNIAAGVREKEGRNERVQALIGSMYLDGEERKYPWQLSGGQQQRVALARILANEPRMLMLDEPFSALDSYLRWQVELELADTMHAYTGATLFVSHSRDEVYRLCDKVCVIDAGKSAPATGVKTLFEHPRTLTEALLSGCKNFSHAQWVGERSVLAVDWGVTLTCDAPMAEGQRYVGIRAHYVAPAEAGADNIVACSVMRVIDDVFSTVVMLRPEHAEATDYGQIRMEIDKDRWRALDNPQALHVRLAPRDIMVLE